MTPCHMILRKRIISNPYQLAPPDTADKRRAGPSVTVGAPCSTTTILAVILAALLTATAAQAAKHHSARLVVESEPTGALVTVLADPNAPDAGPRMIAGLTPVDATFDFGREDRLWLRLEQRGFAPRILEVSAETGRVMVALESSTTTEPSSGGQQWSPPHVVAVLAPDVEVIHRRFSREEVSPEDSATARSALSAAVHSFLGTRCRVVDAVTSGGVAERSLWRDARTPLELLDPIRLPYLTETPRLETRSGRAAAEKVGETAGGEALLLISGRQNEEAGSMVAGKVALGVAGTAVSYASAYSNAMSRGDSFFVYNVVVPSGAEGITLRAILVDASSGEILWVNRGVWKAIDFSNPDQVAEVVTDLMHGCELAVQTTPNPTPQPEVTP